MIMKKLMMLFVMSFMVFALAFGAVHQVAAGTDVVSTAYASAVAGDVIELTTSGGDGVYIETVRFDVDKDITIRAAAGLAEKPLYRTQDSSDPFFKMTTPVRLEIEGIEFDGTDGAGTNVAKYFVIFDYNDTLGMGKLFIEDVEAYEFTDKIIKLYGESGTDSIVVNNSILHGGASEGICLYEGSSSAPAVPLNYAAITNTTIYDIEREAIKTQTYTEATILVDGCTIYDCGTVENKAMLYLNDSEDVIVKNSIFANNQNTDSEPFADFETDVAQFKNNVVWDVLDMRVDKATVSDTLHVDPMFADAANADFTLPLGSALLTFADDGGAIGDPRWVPSAPVHQVAAGTDVISAAIAAANAGDIIELTTSGMDGTYIEGSKLSMTKDITIRAGNVSARPILQQTGGSTNPMVEIKADVHVTFDGLEFQGNNNAKYFIIVDTDDTTTTVELVVKDCKAWDFDDKGIKFYGNSGVDYFEFSNSILSETASEGICLYEGSTSNPAAVIRDVVIKNSTFYDIERECIKAETYAFGSLLIDQITAYNCGDTDGKSMIYVDDWTDVLVKNSIFVGNHYSSYFGRFENADNLFHHNVIWDAASWDIDNATVSDTLRVNPGFADAANGDFTIPETSALMTFADNGGAVGDPRWAPVVGGQKALNVFVDGMGTVTLDPAGGMYDEGTSVTMTATPDPLWVFDHWSDNVAVFPPNNPVATVTVNANMNVTAYFVPTLDKYTITWDAVGLGHVDDVHTAFFPVEGYWEGDTLELTAVADTSTWSFVKWVDADTVEVSTDNPLVYPVTADAHFTAVFNSTLPQYSLELTVTGSGDVSVSPKPVTGFTTYDQGTVVSLVASENMGWEFSGYSGDLVTAVADTSVTMDANKTIAATFIEKAVPGGDLLVDASWDLRDAIEYATYNSNVERIVLTEVGPYAPTEADRSDGKLPQLNIEATIRIVASDTLSSKPVIKGWAEGGSEGLFRMRENGRLYLKDLEVDGYFDESKKTKYLFRLDDGKPIENTIIADNVDFHGTIEAFLKYYSQVHVDSLIFRNCTIYDIGKEGIYDQAAGSNDYLELSNSTFWGIGREIVRLKVQTPVAVIDHVTVDNCGYGDGSKYASFKFEVANQATITNSIISNILNTTYGYSLRMYSDQCIIDNSIVYNSAEIDNNDGAVVGDNVFDVDPMYVDADNQDFTLADASVAYHMASDGSKAIGDLRWATSTNITEYKEIAVTSDGHGDVVLSPAPMGKFYPVGRFVTMTAVADTLYKFGAWSGDVVGTTNPVLFSMNTDKDIMVDFEEAFFEVELNVNMSVWADDAKFTVGTDSVDIAGSMNGWGAVPMWTEDEDGDTIYSYTLIVDENYPNLEWKFRINGSWNDATAEFPLGGPARTFTVVSDTSLTFWYNNDEPVVGVADVPLEYTLNQNYPNPFNPLTTIRFGLPVAEYTRVVLYDVTGREVMTLVDSDMSQGYHDVILNAAHLSSGLYFYSIKAGDYSAVKKLTLLK
jgi:Domain of unknown function (DUF5123)/Divergent InlB B-repeat domain/Secretion system C-terminal sorting domain